MMLTSLVESALNNTLESLGAGPSYASRLAASSLQAGYLSGRCPTTGQWQRRYFVLKPTTLLYYFGSAADEEALGCLDVEAFSHAECGGLSEDGLVAIDLVRSDGGRFHLKTRESDGERWYAALKNETYAELKATNEFLRKQRDDFASDIQRMEEALAAAAEETRRAASRAKTVEDQCAYLATRIAALHGVPSDESLLRRVTESVEALERCKSRGERLARDAESAAARARDAQRAADAACAATSSQLREARRRHADSKRRVDELARDKLTLKRALKQRLGREAAAATAGREDVVVGLHRPPPSPPPPPTEEEEEPDDAWRDAFREQLRRALVEALAAETDPVLPTVLPVAGQPPEEVDQEPPTAAEDLETWLEQDDEEDVDQEVLRIEYAKPKLGIAFSVSRSREIVVAGLTPDYDPQLPRPPRGSVLVAINGDNLKADPEADMRSLKTAARPLLLDFHRPPSPDTPPSDPPSDGLTSLLALDPRVPTTLTQFFK